MAQPRVTQAQLGDLITLVYDFDAVGDILPMHVHDESTSHIIIVAKGGVVVLTQEANGVIESIYQEAGALIDTFAGFPHAVVGIIPGSRTIHVRKRLSPPTAASTQTTE